MKFRYLQIPIVDDISSAARILEQLPKIDFCNLLVYKDKIYEFVTFNHRPEEVDFIREFNDNSRGALSHQNHLLSEDFKLTNDIDRQKSQEEVVKLREEVEALKNNPSQSLFLQSLAAVSGKILK